MVKLSDSQAAGMKGKWFIAYTKNNCEQKVQTGFPLECLVPMTQMVYQRGGKVRSKFVPKYKNYVYIKHDGSVDFFVKVLANEYIQYMPGMIQDNPPLPVPEPDIQHTVEFETKNTVINVKDRVKVVDGYLKNMSGIVVDKDDFNEFTIEIVVFDRPIREVIPREYLIKIEE